MGILKVLKTLRNDVVSDEAVKLLEQTIEYIEKQEHVVLIPAFTEQTLRGGISYYKVYGLFDEPLTVANCESRKVYRYIPSPKLRELSEEEIDAIWYSMLHIKDFARLKYELARAILAAAQEEVK